MPGPTPKPAKLRQRRNRSATAATLPSESAAAQRDVPELPPRMSPAEVWHPKVVEWWESAWRSPMAGEWLDSDVKGGLYRLAELHQKLWCAFDTDTFLAVQREIRLAEVGFGLNPIDRRRLQWEVEKGEVAEERTKTRRQARALKSASKKDPRDVLKLA